MSIRKDYIPCIDPLELARGAIASLCALSGNSFQEIHIGRIQDVWSRTDLLPSDLKGTLQNISIIREAEHLGNGYWLPTPTRVVSLTDNLSIIVSIAPTTELQRHFSSVRCASFSRLVKSEQVSDLPIQSLNSWQGCGYSVPHTWTKFQLKLGSNNYRHSVVSADLEAFGVNEVSFANQSTRRKPIWLSIADRRVVTINDVSILRIKLARNTYRYFLGQIKDRYEIFEGPSIRDNLRFQYGLASLINKPLTVSVRLIKDTIRLRLPLIVPMTVRRLLFALCEMNAESYGYEWMCNDIECWPTIKIALLGLGCEILGYE